MWHDQPLSQTNMTTERGVGVGVGGDREVEVGEGWTKCKKGGRQYRGEGGGVFIK